MLSSGEMKRIPSLDGLRAISILLVMFGHWTTVRFDSRVAEAYSNLGVRVFFIISGYLITTLLLAEHERIATISLRDFYVRRAYRILPAAMVFMVPIFIIFRHQLTWYHAAMAALYLADFDPGRPRFLMHLWSLGVEEQFYFLWPGVMKKWFKHRVPILLGVIAIAPFYVATGYALRLPGADATFPAVADVLAVGCLLAIFAPRIGRIRPWIALVCLAYIALVPMYRPVSKLHTLVLVFLMWPVLHVAIAGLLLHVVQTPYWLLNIGPVVWLGKISYSLYLWQEPFTVTNHPVPVYFLLFAVGLASLSYYLVEQPMLKLREKRATAGKPSPPPAVANERSVAPKIV